MSYNKKILLALIILSGLFQITIGIWMIVDLKSAGYYLSLSTGIMIALIAITTYADTGSYLVWVTDFSRGLLISVFSILLLDTKKSIKAVNT